MLCMVVRPYCLLLLSQCMFMRKAPSVVLDSSRRMPVAFKYLTLSDPVTFYGVYAVSNFGQC